MINTVEEYIENQKSPQKEIIKELRRIILKTCSGIYERMRLGVPYYDDKYYIVGLRDHVNLGFLIIGLSRANIAKLQGNGKTTRHLELSSVQDINEDQIVELLLAVKQID